MSTICLARQPIVNIDEQLQAYEILYGQSDVTVDLNEREASIAVVNAVLNKFGTREFLSDHKAFIRVDEKFLMSDLIKTIPTDFFILSLSQEIEMSERAIERIDQLSAMGFNIGIHNIMLSEENITKYDVVLDKLSYFKINVAGALLPAHKDMIVRLKSKDIVTIAIKIESSQQYEDAKSIGFDWFQGYWFSKPNILEKQKFDPSQFKILKLYNLLMEDTNIDEIAYEFEKNHALALQLLQFINSGIFHFRTHISSIHHILTLVGRKPLSQWLMLMIYSKSVSKDDQVSPLVLMVKNRTELMQSLLKLIKPDVRSNALGEAYLVGALSLMEVVFGVSLEEILENINISDISKNALLNDEGTLGILYKTVRDIEEFNIGEITKFAKRFKLDEEAVQKVILETIGEVNSFENELSGKSEEV